MLERKQGFCPLTGFGVSRESLRWITTWFHVTVDEGSGMKWTLSQFRRCSLRADPRNPLGFSPIFATQLTPYTPPARFAARSLLQRSARAEILEFQPALPDQHLVPVRSQSSCAFPVLHRSPPSFYSSSDDVRCAYSLSYHIINALFFWCISGSNAWVNYLTMLETSLFWRSRNGTKVWGAKFVRCHPELFLRDGSYENSRENQFGVVCFQSPTLSPT
jgi:hypothetical protein